MTRQKFRTLLAVAVVTAALGVAGRGQAQRADLPAAKPSAAAGQWFVPARPSANAVDLGAPLPPGSIGDIEEITVLGKRSPRLGPVAVPDLKGEDMSRYHREPDYLTRSHRAPCTASYASVGGHEDRGGSLATGLGAAGCD